MRLWTIYEELAEARMRSIELRFGPSFASTFIGHALRARPKLTSTRRTINRASSRCSRHGARPDTSFSGHVLMRNCGHC